MVCIFPPSSRDRTSGKSNRYKIQDMIDKVLQKVESIDAWVK